MRLTRRARNNFIFVLTEKDLRAMLREISSYTGSGDGLTITTTGVDKTVRTFATLEELLGFDNRKDRQIHRVSIEAPATTGRGVNIAMDNSFIFDPVVVDVHGTNDRDVNEFTENIEAVFTSMQPWYWWIARADFMAVFPILTGVLALIGGIAAGARGKIDLGFSMANFLGAGVFGVCLLVACILLNWIKWRFFPRAVFAIGQGVQRHRNAETVRQIIVVGFAINVLAGLALLLFTPRG